LLQSPDAVLKTPWMQEDVVIHTQNVLTALGGSLHPMKHEIGTQTICNKSSYGQDKGKVRVISTPVFGTNSTVKILIFFPFASPGYPRYP
jgi:hypothetical protein